VVRQGVHQGGVHGQIKYLISNSTLS
jgi:hypothetical protein